MARRKQYKEKNFAFLEKLGSTAGALLAVCTLMGLAAGGGIWLTSIVKENEKSEILTDHQQKVSEYEEKLSDRKDEISEQKALLRDLKFKKTQDSINCNETRKTN